ncbi:uncharacterized protein BDW70DRAFT_143984 [Aspergillus foveolatus]|uniref:uncharacterized protein n=1 Tax=Aspergillus foveolatus TaxID=210207 RepID=UPI003CCDD037
MPNPWASLPSHLPLLTLSCPTLNCFCCCASQATDGTSLDSLVLSTALLNHLHVLNFPRYLLWTVDPAYCCDDPSIHHLFL